MRQLFIQTDKNYIPSLPRFVFEGRIIVIQSASEAVRAVDALRKYPLLGIDTETRPAFRKGAMHQVALLQASTEDFCFLFRLNLIGMPDCLLSLLADPTILKVGLSLKDDIMMLHRRAEGFVSRGFVDLQNYAAQMGIRDMSLQKLYANVFHMRISKSARLSNWEADVLTESQQKYAATDAYTCIQLYKELKQLRETGQYELIECAKLLSK